MKKFTLRSAAAACAFAMLPMAAQAQVAQPDLPAQSDQAQPGQAQQGQVPPRQVLTPPEQPSEDGQTYEARRIDPAATAAQGQQGLQGFLVQKLMLGNKGEIEISQLAQQKSQNPEVKAFAQKMIKDHQQMNQQLQGLSSVQGQAARPAATARGQGQRQGQSAERSTDQATSPTQPSLGATSGQGELQQLTQLTQRAAETHLKMVKQMLQQYQGQDFDMGYLGQQIAAHTHMLAHLQAIKASGNVGSQEFQQLVSKAEQATTEHLDRAKQLAHQLEDKERGTSSDQSNRSGSTSSSRTDRSQPGTTPAPRNQRPSND